MLLSIYRVLLLIIVCISFDAFTQVPNKLIFQYAGDIGKYSIGVGSRINKYYSYSLHYGFVPPNDIQNKIETYTFKNQINILNYEKKIVQYTMYTGLGLFHVPGNKYKTHEHNGIKDNYYRQSSIRALLYIGHQINLSNNTSIYLESGMNDIWIINSINNDSIDYRDHVSLGIGFNYKL